jgi:hypothetical protein
VRAVLLFVMLSTSIALPAIASPGTPAEYIGGTLSDVKSHTSGLISASDPVSFVFQTRQLTVRIPYERINQLEYGQEAGRRILAAAFVSPLFLLSKKKDHFLTVGFEGEDGKQQALLFEVGKDQIRAVLVSLEARTGRRVEYQDTESRKAGLK